MDVTLRECLTAPGNIVPAVPAFISAESFSSGQCALTFLDNYERCAKSNAWSNELKIYFFFSYLQGAADKWYQLYIAEESNLDKTWDQLKRDFLEEWGPKNPKREARKKLQNLKQGRAEKTLAFYYELLFLYGTYDPSKNFEFFLDYFEDGLADEAAERYYYFTNPNKQPKDWNEVKQIAKLIDNAPLKSGKDKYLDCGKNRTTNYGAGVQRRKNNQTSFDVREENWHFGYTQRYEKSRGNLAPNSLTASVNWVEHHQANRCSSTLVLKILLDGKKQTALLDTGSVRNVVRRDVLPNFGMKRSSGNLITAGGHKIPILGKSELEFRAKNEKFFCEAEIIEESPFPVILGMEFLNNHEALIDIINKKVSLRVNKKYKDFYVGENNPVNKNVTSLVHKEQKDTDFYKRLYQKEVLDRMADHFKSSKRQATLNKAQLDVGSEIGKQFGEFWADFNTEETQSTEVKITEKEVDLFASPDNFALCHCVDATLRMDKGIAVEFRKRFKSTEKLMEQNPKTGDVATLNINGQFVYYLVTKDKCDAKPTYKNLFSSLSKIKMHMEKNNLSKLAMPKIGCGLDGLQGEIVRQMVKFIFSGTKTEILVCLWNPYREKTRRKKSVFTLQNRQSGRLNENFSQLFSRYEEISQRNDQIHGGSKKTKKSTKNYSKMGNIDWTILPGGPMLIKELENENGMAPTKLRLATDLILKFKEEKRLELKMETENCVLDKFILNEKLFLPRHLIATSPPYHLGSKVWIIVKSLSACPVFLYKDSTVGFLENEEKKNWISLATYFEETEDDEIVTIKDHNMEHIKNYRIKEQLTDLLKEYRDVFAKSTKHMGRTNLVKHKIELLDNTPIKSQPYRVSHREREII